MLEWFENLIFMMITFVKIHWAENLGLKTLLHIYYSPGKKITKKEKKQKDLNIN